MAKQQKRLNYFDLLNEMAFVRDRCKQKGMTDDEISKLKFAKQTIAGPVYVDFFKLNIVKAGDEIIILMLPE